MQTDAIIIGAGPAGLQMAYFLQKRKVTYVILEKGDSAGVFFSEYPRQRQLISINKPNSLKVSSDNSLRFDWNSLLCSNAELRFTKYSDQFYPDASTYVKYLNDFAEEHELQIKYNTTVCSVSKVNALFEVRTACGQTFWCTQLFMACGLVEKAIPIDVQNAAHKIGASLSSYGSMTLDLSYYRGKSVAIIGTGNAAFETANFLNNVTESIAMVGPSKVAWKSHYPGHLRSKNMGFIDTLYLKMGNIIYYDEYNAAQVISIQNNFLNHSGSQLHEVIYCGGFQCQLAMLKDSLSCAPKLDAHGFPVLNTRFESENVNNLFFIGASMQSHDWKKGTSSFIHGFRYNIEFMDRVLHNDIHAKTFMNIDEVNNHIIRRINESSCLHHRHKYFCDVIVFNADASSFNCFEDIFIPFFKEFEHMFHKHDETAITVFMDYGSDFEWSLKQPGGNYQSDIIIPFRCDVSKFLHPVFSINIQGKMHVYHVGESPTGQFHHPIYESMVKIYTRFALNGGSLQEVAHLECSIIQLFYDYQEYMQNVFTAQS